MISSSATMNCTQLNFHQPGRGSCRDDHLVNCIQHRQGVLHGRQLLDGMGLDSAGFGRMGCAKRPHMTSHDLTWPSLRIRVECWLSAAGWWVHSFSVKPESPWQLWRASSVRSRAGSTSEAAALICSDVSWLTCHFGHFGQTVNWKIWLRVDQLLPQFWEKGSLSWLLGAYVRSGLHVTSMQLPLAWLQMVTAKSTDPLWSTAIYHIFWFQKSSNLQSPESLRNPLDAGWKFSKFLAVPHPHSLMPWQPTSSRGSFSKHPCGIVICTAVTDPSYGCVNCALDQVLKNGERWLVPPCQPTKRDQRHNIGHNL